MKYAGVREVTVHIAARFIYFVIPAFFLDPADLHGCHHFWQSLMHRDILLWQLSSICGVKNTKASVMAAHNSMFVLTTIPCHFFFYYSPQALIRCGQARTVWRPWNWQSRCCRTMTSPPAWECCTGDFMHSQGEMSCGTMLQKPRLFYDSSVAELWYNIILPPFRVWNTTDSAIKEIWAYNMTGTHTSPYYHV